MTGDAAMHRAKKKHRKAKEVQCVDTMCNGMGKLRFEKRRKCTAEK